MKVYVLKNKHGETWKVPESEVDLTGLQIFGGIKIIEIKERNKDESLHGESIR